MVIVLEKTVGEPVAERPGRARVFEKLGIDYCCGGKKPLSEACAAKGLDVLSVSVLLDAEKSENSSAVDVSGMTLTELADHIEGTHHAYLKTELPRLMPLVERIAARHRDKNPRLPELAREFSAFRAELEAHMSKEERVLFPMIREIETKKREEGAIENPVRMMEMEHKQAGDSLAVMRRLTDDFSTPTNACNTYRAVMHSLRELEADMRQHVHKENNVLFPKAVAASRRK